MAVRRDHSAVKLLVVGSGAADEEVLDTFPESLRPAIEVVPHYENEDLPSLISGVAVLMFPSRSEGYPVVMVEAMVCGIVPVCYDIPGPSHIVKTSGVGRVVPGGDVQRLPQRFLPCSQARVWRHPQQQLVFGDNLNPGPRLLRNSWPYIRRSTSFPLSFPLSGSIELCSPRDSGDRSTGAPTGITTQLPQTATAAPHPANQRPRSAPTNL